MLPLLLMVMTLQASSSSSCGVSACKSRTSSMLTTPFLRLCNGDPRRVEGVRKGVAQMPQGEQDARRARPEVRGHPLSGLAEPADTVQVWDGVAEQSLCVGQRGVDELRPAEPGAGVDECHDEAGQSREQA